MRTINYSAIYRAARDESGQIIMPWVAVLMFSFLGVAGLTLDVGRAYIAHSQLQNAANAAALAAAGKVYNTSSTNDAYTAATSYSASSGDNNVSGAGNVTTTVYEGCANSLMPAGQSCTSTTPKNAVQVSQCTTVRNYIMPIFWSTKTTSVCANATASMQGASKPWNIAVVLDSTQSMSDSSNGTSCPGYSTNYSCALWGIRTLLKSVNPCAGVTNCSISNANARVALFSFPNVSTATVADNWDCSSTTPTNEPYTLPLPGQSGYVPISYNGSPAVPTSTYEATPVNTLDGDANGFVWDYWSGSTSTNLSASSYLAKEVGGVSGCSGMTNPGGENTYYASVIYAAQAALAAESASNGNKNALIILSDGEAQAGNTKFPGYTGGSATTVTPSANGIAVTKNSSTSTLNLTNAASTFGLYPDFHNDCQQAITAAQAAQTAGTDIFVVAFGSETTTSCTTDTKTTATATSGQSAISYSTLTPCIALKNMASVDTTTETHFYADQVSANNGCTDTAHPISMTQIGSIFSSLGSIFTTPKMLPNSTFTFGVAQSS